MNKRQKLFVTATTIIVLTASFAIIFYSVQNETESGKLKVVATFYPLAFFVQQIGGEEVTIKQLIPDNTEVHNWQPSLADILALNEADVIIYNSASFEHWFKNDLIPVINSSNKIIIETTKGIQLLETKETNKEDEGTRIYDPHTWISPFLAKHQAQNIYEALIHKDPNHMDYYTERWQNLKKRFEVLDNNYQSELSTIRKKEIFVAHSAFGYLASRYGFEQHGVIGISADEQPSTTKYVDLTEMMIANETYVVYVDPVYSSESAQILKNELNRLSGHDVQILKLYVMLGDLEGIDYFGQQEKNLENLKIGLEA